MRTEHGFAITDSPSLATRTSIGLGGSAIAEVCLSGTRGLEELPGLASRIGGSVALLGEGTNIIARDGRLSLLLVTQTTTFGVRVLKEQEHSVLLRVQAGTRLPALLAKAASLSLSGLEGLTGIPGSVGGAVAMNAGSFGVSMGQRVRSLLIFSPRLGLVERPAGDFDFTYRSCALRGHGSWFLVSEVTLELYKGDRQSIREAMRGVYLKKQASQPVTARSAGCVFKNPAPDAPAGRLLEEAGLKGLRIGGMRFSPLHANFLINEGGGEFQEAMDLVDLARDKVQRHSGHILELEVRIWS